MKAAVFDIECTDLSAIGSGIVLCTCIRPLSTQCTRDYRLKYRKEWDQKTEGFLQVEETNLLEEVRDELAKYDLLIGHNVDKFDLHYLRSRCFRRGLDFPLNPFTYDTMKMFGRTGFRTRLNSFGKPSKSMDMVADFLGIEQLKTKIYPAEHWMTVWGNDLERETSMADLLDHCRRDVRLNAQIYEMLLPFDHRAVIRRWM